MSTEPQRRLPEAARPYWRLSVALRSMPVLVVAVALSGAAPEIGLPGWLPVAVALVLAVAATLVMPELWWRRWRYEVRDEEIDLRHGLVTLRRTLVPIRRVQHVDTESGPLQSSFDLATVSFHTAAGPTRLPALTRGEAEEVRRRVGELARTRDDV